ncbi:MAG TPA: hypothetical protein VHM90_12770, partial [Phycisphaerae bacterium]|nr:hypothetical protein [Phycisphaerae bacterium]
MAVAFRNFSPRQLLNQIVGSVVHWISLNAVILRNATVYKRRNYLGRKVTPMANWFFRTCRAPVMFWKDLGDWQQWEIKCYQMLHPHYQAIPVGPDAICIDQLPGKPLWDHLKAGTLTEEMIEAAAREFSRAHAMWSDIHNGPWSHGDGAMGNVLYDPASGRALLIDFEIIHQRDLPAVTRQADDLHAFLMDLVSLNAPRRWLPLTLAFLRTYDRADVIAEFRRRLEVPRGAAWIWWKMRVNFVPEGKVASRMAKLAKAIDQGALSANGVKVATSGRRNHSRRPASACQTISPGMPNASSRTRRM